MLKKYSVSFPPHNHIPLFHWCWWWKITEYSFYKAMVFRCGTILHFSRRLYIKKDCKILTWPLSLMVKILTHSRMNLFHMKILFRITEGKLPHCRVLLNSVGSFKNGIRSSSCMSSPQYLYSWLVSDSKNMLFSASVSFADLWKLTLYFVAGSQVFKTCTFESYHLSDDDCKGEMLWYV